MGRLASTQTPLILPVASKIEFSHAILKAAQVLRAGGVVAYPTETFYGLGVDATDKETVSRLFDIKGREKGKPVLILVSSEEMLFTYIKELPANAIKLIKQFWPGPLTLILKSRPRIPELLTGGTGKVGVRLSSHPVATAIVRETGVPITSTSANRSTEPPCNSAREVSSAFGNSIDLIIDGGTTRGGPGSTIIDVTVSPPRIIRHGEIPLKHLEKVIGEKILS